MCFHFHSLAMSMSIVVKFWFIFFLHNTKKTKTESQQKSCYQNCCSKIKWFRMIRFHSSAASNYSSPWKMANRTLFVYELTAQHSTARHWTWKSRLCLTHTYTHTENQEFVSRAYVYFIHGKCAFVVASSERECASKELPLIFGCRLFFSPFRQQCLGNFIFLSIRSSIKKLELHVFYGRWFASFFFCCYQYLGYISIYHTIWSISAQHLRCDFRFEKIFSRTMKYGAMYFSIMIKMAVNVWMTTW